MKSIALTGLNIIGPKYFGVFPLQGSFLNIDQAQWDNNILENEEIQNIERIMGFQRKKEYKNLSGLRYGSIMIMVNQVCSMSNYRLVV